MRITLTVAAFTIAAFLPLTSRAASADAGDAGTSSEADAGASSEAHGGGAGSAGKAAGGAATTPAGPGPNLPDPGTDTTNSCAVAGPRGTFGAFGSTLALGAAFLMLRRRRVH